MRAPLLQIALISLLPVLDGCDKEPAAASQELEPNGKGPKVSAATPTKAPEKTAFAKPVAEAPPPPEGALLLEKGELYVRSCADEVNCPMLLQAQGETFCGELELGTFHDWRLPLKDEVPGLAALPEAERREGYHWTGSADEMNAKMAWIVDPAGAQPTTIPRDRKPFRIRCVRGL